MHHSPFALHPSSFIFQLLSSLGWARLADLLTAGCRLPAADIEHQFVRAAPQIDPRSARNSCIVHSSGECYHANAIS
ncbi:hypothetical protein EsDP_00002822 [Epichloe bromicola]|uniref:Secreted protein n=1 Tax=Epichloe bromicola TaxID=79588 RepID=A0ABQ0CLZ5_9HYPO